MGFETECYVGYWSEARSFSKAETHISVRTFTRPISFCDLPSRISIASRFLRDVRNFQQCLIGY